MVQVVFQAFFEFLDEWFWVVVFSFGDEVHADEHFGYCFQDGGFEGINDHAFDIVFVVFKRGAEVEEL